MQSTEINVQGTATEEKLMGILPDTPRPALRFAGWINAWKHVWAIYLATHLAFLVLTLITFLFTTDRFANAHAPLQTLLHFWNRYDTNWFVRIATLGYYTKDASAFFPLYPILIHLVTLVVRHPVIAAMLIANVANLGVLLVLYRLVAEDFGEELAARSVLYLAIFPTAFFLAAGYSEALFLLFVLAAFYLMRRRRWWLAGLVMFLATLTRSTGVVLVVPFCYEYLRQRDFQWRKIRLNVLSVASVGLAVLLYSAYCYYRFHDFLSFSHVEGTNWGRHLTFPGEPLLRSALVILVRHTSTYSLVRNLIQLSIVLAILAVLILSFVGPWKFARKNWMYSFYGVAVFFMCVSLPVTAPSDAPLDSIDRYMLAIFPIAIMFAVLGKNRNFHILYQALGYTLLAVYTLLFLTHQPFVA